MAIPWKQVESNPEFQALSSAQKKMAQEQYFNEVVAPLAGDNAAEAKAQFFSQYNYADDGIKKDSQGNVIDYGTSAIPGNENEMSEAEKLQTFGKGVGDFSAGEQLIGAGEAALSAATGSTSGLVSGAAGGIAGAIADLAGILTPEEAQSLQQRAAAAGTYEPKSEAGKKIISEVGEAAQWLPPVMGAQGLSARASGVAPVPKTAASVAGQAAKSFERSDRMASPYSSAGKKPTQVQQEILATKGSSPADLERIVKPDPSMIRARENLGYEEKGTPALVSRSRQYRETEGGLASQIGAKLDEQQYNFIQEHQKKADELIKRHGGQRDAQMFDEAVKGDIEATIKNLGDDSDILYKSAFKQLDESGEFGATVDTKSIYSELISKAKKAGKGDLSEGVKKLNSVEKKILDEVKPKEVKPGLGGYLEGKKTVQDFSAGSYANLDRIRKDIGQSIGGFSGKFKDEERGMLSKYYGMLSDAQEKAARTVSPDAADKIAQGKKLIMKRKDLEDRSVQMFGKDLDKSFQDNFSKSLVSAANGNPTVFNRLMSAVPEKQKASAIMTGLYRAMQGSKREMSVTPKAAADFWSNLKKQPSTMKAIMRDLHPEARRDVGQFMKVNDGLARALSSRVYSGRAATSSGFIDNLAGGLGNIAVQAASAKTGGGAGVIADAVGAGIKSIKNRKHQKAIDMLTDESFLRDLSYIVKNKAKADRAKIESKMMRNKKVNDWLETLSDQDISQIQNVGLLTYFTQQSDQDAKK